MCILLLLLLSTPPQTHGGSNSMNLLNKAPNPAIVKKSTIISSERIWEWYNAWSEMLTSEVRVNLNMLRPLMKNWIGGNLHSWLSRAKGVRVARKTPKSAKNLLIWTMSLVVVAIALNSASQLKLETTSCFLLRHEISESPRNKQKPTVEQWVYGQPA